MLELVTLFRAGMAHEGLDGSITALGGARKALESCVEKDGTGILHAIYQYTRLRRNHPIKSDQEELAKSEPCDAQATETALCE